MTMGSMRERMLAGELYIADDPVLSEEHLRAMDLIEQFNRSPASDNSSAARSLNTVVGAGSVVTRDLPANVVAMGSPARVIRPLPD